MAALRAGKGIVRMPAPKAPARIGVMLYAEIKGIFRYIGHQLSFIGRCTGTHEGYIGTMERFCRWKI